MAGFGPVYATCVLRPFAEHLIAAVGGVAGRSVMVVPGDAGTLGSEIRRLRGSPSDTGADMALALGTLGVAGWPATTLGRMDRAVGSGAIAAVHFTQTSAHELIAQAALGSVHAAAPDPSLVRISPSAIEGFTVTTIRDVARFDSPRQFYAALIAERNADAGLDAVQRRRILEYCTRELASVTAFDDTVRLPIEALLLVRPALV